MGSRLPSARRLLLLAGLILIGGGGAAAACKISLNCHLNSTPQINVETLTNEIAQYEGKPAQLAISTPGLKATVVARGFTYPTDFAFLPGGQIIVAEKSGVIRLVEPGGAVATTPFLDLRPRTDTEFFRGIVGMAVDPDFAAHPYVYVAYTPRLGPTNSKGSTVMRISRFRVDGNRADPASEKVIIGADDKRPCEDQPSSADCLPSELDVDGADIVFAPDGTLFVSTGYGGGFEKVEQSAMLAENIDTLGGKILHVDRDGQGLSDNPYWNGDPNANRSKVWARGFRNPFRMALLPESPTTLAVGQVGWDTWESLSRTTRGSDFGWPCYEAVAPTMQYDKTPFCHAYYRTHPQAPSTPWVAIKHPLASTIISGSALASATALPERYRKDFVFGDWVTGKITLIPENTRKNAPQTLLAQGAAGPDRFRIGPDGALFYLAANIGELRRIAAK